MSAAITIYGSSDDLIELEGGIDEEFYLVNDGDGDLLTFSCGVVLRVAYTDSGVWRITPVTGGEMVAITPAPEDDEDNYSDRAVIAKGAAWVAHGNQFVLAKATS